MNEQLKIALGEFWHVAWVLIVIIAGISVLTGFMREYIPQEKLQKKLKNQGTVKGSMIGASLGVLTPFCSASMVPVAMGMIEMSLPFSTVLPFLISAPLCNFVVVGIIFGTFGFKVAVTYFLWTFCGAIVAGLTVGRSRAKLQVKDLTEIVATRKDTCSCQPSTSRISHKDKARGAFRFAIALFKQIAPYAIIGAAISGIALAYIPSTIVEKYVGGDSWFAIPIASIIGVPLYLRIEMAIPLLSTLLTKGMSMGAAMALLIGGTGASLPELAILSSMLKPKGIIVFVMTIFVLATLGGMLFMLFNNFNMLIF